MIEETVNTEFEEAEFISEPQLEFRHGQKMADPRNGLSLFGPFDSERPTRLGSLTYGLIGTEEGVKRFQRFANKLSEPIVPDSDELRTDVWKPYPGFEAAFNSNFPDEPAWSKKLPRDALLEAARRGDGFQRAYEVSQHYLDALELAEQRDEKFGLVFCIVPEEVHSNCRPKSKVSTEKRTSARPSAKERKALREGQTTAFGQLDPEVYQYSKDFRRQLKARSMQYGNPIQIIRETTLKLTPQHGKSFSGRSLTPLSDRAWNLSTTAYYKGGGKPWRLAAARDGVCYVGLAFRKADDREGRESACCAAQMFLDTGDGVVFKGEYGPWYSPARSGQQFHLSSEAAEHLLTGVIEEYRKMEGKELNEIFLHSRSPIWDEEFSGYAAAAPSSAEIVGIQVSPEHQGGIKLFRQGDYPVPRGTLWRLSEREALLWGSGFRPSVQTYPGSNVPRPIRIEIQHGEADIRQVATDILGLTKLNYNACRPGDRMPVTVKYSQKVGEILIDNQRLERARPQFKFYI